MTKMFLRLLRAALSGFFFLAYGFFALPFALVLPLPFVSKRFGRAAVRVFYRLFVFLARLTGLYRVDFRARDDGTMVAPRGRIVVMNHVSLIDICVLLAHLPDSVCIAKASAKRNPFLAAVVRKLFIANDQGGADTLAEAEAYLRRGVNVVVFPQGTRGGTRLHRGAARLSLATGTAIQAYHVVYDPVVLAKGQPWWDVGARVIRITVETRACLDPEGSNDHRGAVALTARIAAAIA